MHNDFKHVGSKVDEKVIWFNQYPSLDIFRPKANSRAPSFNTFDEEKNVKNLVSPNMQI